jgi:Large ribosomal RNA subunit accumulation protein YceD
MNDQMTMPFSVRGLSPKKPTRFDLKPTAAERAHMAADLGITAVLWFRLTGAFHPVGRRDFRLEATLEAEVEQPCGITLAPVRTKLLEQVMRLYLAEWQEPTGAEVEIAADDDAEPLPDVIDVAVVGLEGLSLALPPYPRAPGAELGQMVHAEPGTAALTDEAIRPFAGLAALKDKLGKN